LLGSNKTVKSTLVVSFFADIKINTCLNFNGTGPKPNPFL